MSSELAEIISNFILKNLKTKRPLVPLIVGLNGVQGSGKTTVCERIQRFLSTEGGRSAKVTSISLSMDDFYLTYAEQCSLFQRTGNPLLEYRGLPGSHDLALANNVLHSLARGKPTLIPRYDKSLNSGRGDRLPVSEWTRQESSVDVILFEGWSMGFRPLSVSPVSRLPFGNVNMEHFHDWKCSLDNLVEINNNLSLYEKEWYPLIDIFVQIKPLDVKYVFDWRWEQEENLKRKATQQHSANGLSKDQVVDFVNRFMPAYFLYLDNLSNHGFFPVADERFLQVTIDRTRSILSSTVI